MIIPAICIPLALLVAPVGREVMMPVVEVEETIYTYVPPNNGAGPMWCYGSSCIVRYGDDVFVSGLETLEGVKPLNNCRWTLFGRDEKGWRLIQSDPKGRQREPCPLGVFSNGTLVLSTNPTLNPPDTEGGGPANPHLLKLSCAHPKALGKPLQPVWAGRPTFGEHSYRGMGIDAANREVVILNKLGYNETHWAYLNKHGKWTNKGIIIYPIPGCYPEVALVNGACHVFAVGDIWEPVEEWLKWKRENKIWEYVFRRLFYLYNSDIARKQFPQPVEIDNVESTAGRFQNLDLWVDGSGNAHLLYSKNTVLSKDMRDKFFPGTPIVTSLEYCVVRNGKVVRRKTLIAAGEGHGTEYPGFARLHSTKDGRLFVFYHCAGTDRDGRQFDENRLMEIKASGECSKPVTVKLKRPFTNFMLATQRGGSPPSNTIDVLGSGGAANEIRYARIKIPEKQGDRQ